MNTQQKNMVYLKNIYMKLVKRGLFDSTNIIGKLIDMKNGLYK